MLLQIILSCTLAFVVGIQVGILIAMIFINRD